MSDLTNGQLRNSYITALQSLKGKECWKVVAGVGTGTHVSLHLGGRALQRSLFTRPGNSTGYHETGEYRVFIECSWRIETRDHVITSCWVSNEADGPMLTALNRLIGAKVADCDVSYPGLDLGIHFDNGLTLRMFCDAGIDSDDDEGDSNYSVAIGEQIFVVGHNSLLGLEIRSLS